MRSAISLDPTTGTSRWQEEDVFDISYAEILQVECHLYERQDIAAPKPVPMAEISWADARPMSEKLKQVSDYAFAIEAHRRGMRVVSAQNILNGKYHDSGVKKHKRRNKSQTQG